MGSSKYYRKYIEKMIATNPADIAITRTVRQDDGFGGIDEQVVTLPPQTVTFYNRRSQREVISDSGVTIGYMASSVEKLLILSDADILEKDEFTHAGREYRVIFIKPYLDICKQAEVEVIK